jgi:hypothetical protein
LVWVIAVDAGPANASFGASALKEPFILKRSRDYVATDALVRRVVAFIKAIARITRKNGDAINGHIWVWIAVIVANAAFQVALKINNNVDP